ncbi:MAG TPA: hypothetical protein VN833_29485 [Candidatus Acidoferrales bacterium]|nr:hypothetical protein [Candidatus Acidoferrales bacterium]
MNSSRCESSAVFGDKASFADGTAEGKDSGCTEGGTLFLSRIAGGGREGADTIYSCLHGDSTTVGVPFVLGVMNDSIV